MTIELYGFPGTRANRVQWLLEELQLPYEYRKVDVTRGEHKQPDHLERHPHGVVPALVDGGLPLIESTAMVLHLVDKAGKLAPPLGSAERARLYQFVIYANASLDGPAVQYFFHTVFFPAERRDPAKAEGAKPQLETGLDFLSRELGDAAYLVGDEFSAADVSIGYPLALMAQTGLLAGRERLSSYFERLASRPAFKRVFS
ncbi:MAG: glutathione S-transferase family protein [Enhygromyxa sp.]